MERKIKNQKGITLVALVITIIVMLILVAVSVTVAINGGLFTKAKEAGNEWEDKSTQEAAGNIVKVNVNGTETTMNIDSTINTLKDRPKTQTPDSENPGTEPPAATTITFTYNKTSYTTDARNWEEWTQKVVPEYDFIGYRCTETEVYEVNYGGGVGGRDMEFLICHTDAQGQYDPTRPVSPTEAIVDGASYACYTLNLD